MAPPNVYSSEVARLGQKVRIEPTERLTVVKDDPDDDKIVECAAAAGFDYLVTGDRHILKLGSHGKTQIVRPAEFFVVAQGRTR
jgi:predicted nucleic acid-binding protein